MPTAPPSSPPGAPRAWWPPAPTIDRREALRIALGAALGLLLAGGLARLSHLGPVWLVAPLGASAVLVFGLPSSPLAQPWAVVGGNTLSALTGIATLHLVPDPVWAAGLAVGLAIAAMVPLRCLHPPGGAAALLTVLAGVHDPRFALFPVLVNSAVLVAFGVAYNRFTGRRYPHVPAPPAPVARRFDDADIDAVLARHNMLMHTPRDELEGLLEEAELQAHGRRLRQWRCADIMTREPAIVDARTPLPEAWALLRRHAVKALPVVDAQRHVVGLVTQADFLRDARVDILEHPSGHPRWQVRSDAGGTVGGPAVVGQIMVRRVRVTRDDRPLAELVPIFSETGHHHLPVIDAERRLVGILTQTDMVRALQRFAQADGEPDGR